MTNGSVTTTTNEPAITGTDLAGTQPIFPGLPGAKLGESLSISEVRTKRLIFNRLRAPGHHEHPALAQPAPGRP